MRIRILETPMFKQGSARAARYTAIKRYKCKDVEASVAANSKKLPAVNKHGEGEPQNGRLRSFEREVVIQSVD